MDNIRKFYGDTIIKIDNDKEDKCNQFKVEYYQLQDLTVENQKSKFGIEIIKKTNLPKGKILEKAIFTNLTSTEAEISQILCLMHKNEVTPIAVEDILKDLKKIE